MARKRAAPVIEAEPTFTIPAVPVVEVPKPLTPEQIEAEVMVSAAQAVVNELGREVVSLADARIGAIRVVQSARKLIDMMR